MQDEMIVSLYWLRDERAIDETKSKYDRYLYKIAYNVLSDSLDSEESVNDTYLAAWNSIPPHKPTALSTYLSKLTRRISIDMFRRRTREKRKASEYALSLAELNDCVSGEGNPVDETETKLLADAINAFVRSLPEDAKNAFVGRYYFLDPLSVVAKYCKMSESKAKSLLYRTRCALKEHLQKEGFDI